MRSTILDMLAHKNGAARAHSRTGGTHDEIQGGIAACVSAVRFWLEKPIPTTADDIREADIEFAGVIARLRMALQDARVRAARERVFLGRDFMRDSERILKAAGLHKQKLQWELGKVRENERQARHVLHSDDERKRLYASMVEAQTQCQQLALEVERLSEEVRTLRSVKPSLPAERAFVEVARIALSEQTFHRLWERSLERCGQGPKSS